MARQHVASPLIRTSRRHGMKFLVSAGAQRVVLDEERLIAFGEAPAFEKPASRQRARMGWIA